MRLSSNERADRWWPRGRLIGGGNRRRAKTFRKRTVTPPLASRRMQQRAVGARRFLTGAEPPGTIAPVRSVPPAVTVEPRGRGHQDRTTKTQRSQRVIARLRGLRVRRPVPRALVVRHSGEHPHRPARDRWRLARQEPVLQPDRPRHHRPTRSGRMISRPSETTSAAPERRTRGPLPKQLAITRRTREPSGRWSRRNTSRRRSRAPIPSSGSVVVRPDAQTGVDVPGCSSPCDPRQAPWAAPPPPPVVPENDAPAATDRR